MDEVTDPFRDLLKEMANPSPALARLLGELRGSARPTDPESWGPKIQAVHPRLTQEQRAEIVRRHLAGEMKKPLARAFGVDVRTIRKIVRDHSGPPAE